MLFIFKKMSSGKLHLGKTCCVCHIFIIMLPDLIEEGLACFQLQSMDETSFNFEINGIYHTTSSQ